MLQMRLNSNPNRKRMVGMLVKTESSDLGYLRGLIEAGKINPVIDRTYPIEKIAEAHEYVGYGHAKGKVVIKIV